jgi:hypothetical protein
MKTKRKNGRPSSCTPEVIAEICRRTAHGETLNQIGRDETMPARGTILRWQAEDRCGFRDLYARAKDEQLEYWAQEIVDIAEDGKNDWMERELKSGAIVEVVNREVVERSKLRIETRKWLLAKLKPKKYGERLQVAGDDESPLQLKITTEADEFTRRIAGQTARSGEADRTGEPH